jgi:hypothetical protein
MDFERFDRRAREAWEEIPPEYTAGVDGLTVSRERRRDPDGRDVYTLGECLTESYPSDWEGPDTLRSRLVLYHGSFRALAARDPGFDWEEELWETITHELRHHLESLAAEDALEGVDYAADQEFRRYDGSPFEPHYYRSGEALGRGLYAVEKSRYLELPWPASGEAAFEWDGARYAVSPPPETADVAYLDIVAGLPGEPPPELTVVLLRPRGRWEALTRLVRGRGQTVVEAEREARTLPSPAPRGDDEPGAARAAKEGP